MSDTIAATPQPTLTPPQQSDSSAFSLLSLSIAAASAAPIPILGHSTGPVANGSYPSPQNGNSATSTSVGSGGKQHRRLASTGKARRRLSDARDAATRPSPTSLTTTTALSLATLTLSSSVPVVQGLSPVSITTNATLPMTVPISTNGSANRTTSSVSFDDGRNDTPLPLPSGTVNHAKPGKKRGTDHKCESCSKIYRHPSCLIKHRWEHTPHWREASKFVLSKHQQVQLLEAAAILSHFSPSSATGTSLPEDRSLWPSFLSGGTLPPPSAEGNAPAPANNATPPSTTPYDVRLTSSSVPASTIFSSNTSRATSTGPRLHDYSIPASARGTAGVTQLRPGLLGIPTGPTSPPQGSLPVPVPVPNTPEHRGEYRSMGGKSEPWGSPASLTYGDDSVHSSRTSAAMFSSIGGGWSLPRSSLRSVSVSSYSRSRSGSRSDDEDEFVDVDVDVEADMDDGTRYGQIYGYKSRRSWKKEEDELSVGFSVREEDEDGAEKGKEQEWDGGDMEMEMD